MSAHTPKIGKTVLETLTSGMYDDARFIFREYVQNAADQIDVAVEAGILNKKSEGKIEITINDRSKRISVYDNATGISSKNLLNFLGDVANSHKDPVERRGFRGIGRLGGLGYCDKLVFETSYKGEKVKNKLTIDAKRLRKIIENRKDTSDAAAAMSVVTLDDPPTQEDSDAHYFRVILESVSNEILLNKDSVKAYLSMVAPVPFSPSFKFVSEIKTYFKSRKVIIDEYNVEINGETLYKAYKNTLSVKVRESRDIKESPLIGVDFVDIIGDNEELLAACWYGFIERSNNVPDESNIERGLRIRTKNISIGDESTCKRYFDQERTNLRFVGEIHTVNDGFIPNARRDYFTENATCQLFDKKAKEIFKRENLENRLAQTASKLHNRLSEIKEYKKKSEEFRSQKGSYKNAKEESYHLNRLKDLEEKAVKAKAEIEKIARKAEESKNIKNLYQSIVGDNDISVKNLTGGDVLVSKYDPPTFSKLNKDQALVILEVFEILDDELDFDMSELIKKKIVEKYN